MRPSILYRAHIEHIEHIEHILAKFTQSLNGVKNQLHSPTNNVFIISSNTIFSLQYLYPTTLFQSLTLQKPLPLAKTKYLQFSRTKYVSVPVPERNRTMKLFALFVFHFPLLKYFLFWLEFPRIECKEFTSRTRTYIDIPYTSVFSRLS